MDHKKLFLEIPPLQSVYVLGICPHCEHEDCLPDNLHKQVVECRNCGEKFILAADDELTDTEIENLLKGEK